MTADAARQPMIHAFTRPGGVGKRGAFTGVLLSRTTEIGEPK